MPKTVVIIPTYNEADNIGSIVAAVRGALSEAHILIVDDNSPDGTGRKAAELSRADAQVRLLSRKGKEGLGKAYLHAFREVLADPEVRYIVTMDADHSHDPAYLPLMLERAEAGADFVIGSRYVPGGRTEGWETWRRFLSSGGNFYARLVTGLPVRDITAGFTLMSAALLRTIDLGDFHASGYAFQMELKAAAKRAGARFAEVPILFRNRKEGESKISGHIVREGLIAPWLIRFRK